MTEQEWLASNDPAAMLRLLTEGPHPVSPGARASDRQLRLFACACCRQVWHLLTDERSRRVVEVAELRADGSSKDPAVWEGVHSVAYQLGWVEARYAASETSRRSLALWDRDQEELRGIQAALLRDIFGNPWKPGRIGNVIIDGLKGGQSPACWIDPDVLFWHDGLLPQLAEAAYQERGKKCSHCDGIPRLFLGGKTREPNADCLEPCGACGGTGRIDNDGTLNPERLLVLADALEEAGCADTKCDTCGGIGTQDRRKGPLAGVYARWPCDRCNGSKYLPNPLLVHLRSPSPHVRGCWVIDLLTGRS